MPLDVAALTVLTKELNEKISGMKIDKIKQPENDEIVLSLRGKGGANLVISQNPANPRIHLSAQKKESPLSAPPFCMHLRKYITGAVIEHVSLLGGDRIVDICLLGKNELFDTVTYHLIAELMGRYSNILLTDEDYIISDAIKRIPPDAGGRIIVPSAKYLPPDMNKIPLCDTKRLQEVLVQYDNETLFSAYLTANTNGFAPSTAKTLSETSNADSLKTLEIITQILQGKGEFIRPCVIKENAEAKDYSILAPKGKECEFFSSLSDAMDYFYGLADAKERLRHKVKSVKNAVENAIKKTENKLKLAHETLKESDDAEIYKKKGELILANLFRIKNGSSEAVCPDYETGNDITIELEPTLYPAKNAERYFAKYKKSLRAKSHASERVENYSAYLEYLYTLRHSVETCESISEAALLEEECMQNGLIRKQNKRKTKELPAKPLKFEYEGYCIYVGKNNLQNEYMTFKAADNRDIWLHTKVDHGSHVLIKTTNGASEEAVVFAAELAAYYSDAKQAKCEVAYTLRKNVKRHPSGFVGMAVYTDYKTISVTPCSHADCRVR